MSISYTPLTPDYFIAIIALGNQVHGANYLDLESLQAIYEKSWAKNINASWVAVDNDHCTSTEDSLRQVHSGYLVGFRLTLAAQQWTIDEWCSPELWLIDQQQVCYFKCNTVDETCRGEGIGKQLLHQSIQSAKAQGAIAGLAHIWLASPNNSAFGYFSACGGKFIKEHANRWQIYSIKDEYHCLVCGSFCTCTGAEMLLTFNELA